MSRSTSTRKVAVETREIPLIKIVHEDGLLTAQQACAYLNIGRSTMARWISDNAIRAYRLPNGDLRFRMNDLKGLLSPVQPDMLNTH